jgi:hypothetical protein
MPHGHPMIARKFVQHPLATEPPEPAVLLATERACRPVVDTVVIHTGHSRDAIARNPIIGIAGCCARAPSGDAAAPPRSAMNSRRFTA